MPAKSLEPFLERDFKVYARHRQDDPEYNALRLGVRRKLKAIADAVKARAKEAGYTLDSMAGLHHPYSFNSFRVREQRAYLCRGSRERKKLAAYFGEALGKDAETHYIQTVLEVSMDHQVVEAALRIHPQAWWDGQNLKKRTATEAGMAEWCQLLRSLPGGFGLRMHDWRNIWWASEAHRQNQREYFDAYTPGDHWLHLVRELPQEDALAMGAEGPEWVATSLLSLLPTWAWILWTP
ncbi:MAG: hypothetical protein IPM29_01430 [Planctomycetes bacterium]|nr:hypothetical protein [Planctomycetota bacterium]